jgi:hypothetical protein
MLYPETKDVQTGKSFSEVFYYRIYSRRVCSLRFHRHHTMKMSDRVESLSSVAMDRSEGGEGMRQSAAIDERNSKYIIGVIRDDVFASCGVLFIFVSTWRWHGDDISTIRFSKVITLPDLHLC